MLISFFLVVFLFALFWSFWLHGCQGQEFYGAPRALIMAALQDGRVFHLCKT